MGVPNQFVAKTIIESVKVNQNFAVACFSGEILMHGGDVAPAGWLTCDGASYLRADYPDLFATIGTKYGSDDGTHFNVPNLKGRVPTGLDSGQTEFNALGKSGGEKIHQLLVAELPSHYHTVDPPATNSGTESVWHQHGDAGHRHSIWRRNTGTGGDANSFNSATQQTYLDRTTELGYASIGNQNALHYHTTDISVFNSGSSGTDSGHNNLQPYLVINFIIKT
ncbi:MAG: tail fiber protein [bacterium]